MIPAILQSHSPTFEALNMSIHTWLSAKEAAEDRTLNRAVGSEDILKDSGMKLVLNYGTAGIAADEDDSLISSITEDISWLSLRYVMQMRREQEISPDAAFDLEVHSNLDSEGSLPNACTKDNSGTVDSDTVPRKISRGEACQI